MIFTDSALWAGSVIESPCPSVCVSVTSRNTHFRRLWRPLFKERILNSDWRVYLNMGHILVCWHFCIPFFQKLTLPPILIKHDLILYIINSLNMTKNEYFWVFRKFIYITLLLYEWMSVFRTCFSRWSG